MFTEEYALCKIFCKIFHRGNIKKNFQLTSGIFFGVSMPLENDICILKISDDSTDSLLESTINLKG